MKTITLAKCIGILAILISGCSSESNNLSLNGHSLLYNNNEHPEGFYPGEEAIVQVHIAGETLYNLDVRAKVDVVFILDRSYSTHSNDPDDKLKDDIALILSGMNPTLQRTNVIYFKNEAKNVCVENEGLSTSFNSLIGCLNELSAPSGNSNMADAMKMANEDLSVQGANHRIAIMFTDGYPELGLGYDMNQDALITSEIIPDAVKKDIAYYIIYLPSPFAPGNEETYRALLSQITEKTGGKIYNITDINEVFNIIKEILTQVGFSIM